MNNVRDISTKLERWTEAFAKDGFSIKVSNHGRLSFSTRLGETHYFSCIESMHVLKGLLETYKALGFGDAPPPEPPVPLFPVRRA